MKTRFSPSNTGLMHLGNTRTAVVSYMMAKQNDGKFILRIEDTDLARSEESWTTNILETLGWLGITADEPLSYQMQNHANKVYEKAAKKLIDKGFAYYCQCSTDDLKRMKAYQIATKSKIGYNGTCKEHRHTSGVLRLDITAIAKHFGVPRIPIRDVILGERFEDYRNLPDPVLLRADGTPTYLMANTVDDANSDVSFITRGSDLYPQTSTQVLLHMALRGSAPTYAHLPLMYNENGSKLSKRSPDTKGILQYKAEGYLPDAILQFSLSLGNMSIPTDRAVSFEEIVKIYDLSATNNRATSFVEHKIKYINRLHIRATDNTKLSTILQEDYGIMVKPDTVELFKYRADTLVELADNIRFVVDSIKDHRDELMELARDNFSIDKCKQFRQTVLSGRSTPPVQELIKIVA